MFFARPSFATSRSSFPCDFKLSGAGLSAANRVADPFASLDDDYLTWAPAPARIRQVVQAGATDKTVVLTNDPEQPVPPGRKHPLDGNVAFAKSVATGATATGQTLELVLPKDGAWVDFIVAGSFPRASTEDKDAVIEVHEGSAGCPVVLTHNAMVRIRKDHRNSPTASACVFSRRFRGFYAKTRAMNGSFEFMRLGA